MMPLTCGTVDAPGSTGTHAFGITDIGKIVGLFEVKDGKSHADLHKASHERVARVRTVRVPGGGFCSRDAPKCASPGITKPANAASVGRRASRP